MDSDSSEKAFKRVLATVVVAEVLVGLGILYFVSPIGKNVLTGLRSFLAESLALLTLLVSIVLVATVLLILRLSTKMPPMLAELSRRAGIQFKRKRGNIGKLITPSVLGFGLYFEGVYENARVQYSEGKSRRGANSLRKLSILHPRTLELDFLCGYPRNALGDLASINEHRDLAALKVDLDLQGLEIWAAEKEKALSLLKETDVSSGVRELSRIIDEIGTTCPGSAGNYGFFMNDVGLTVVLAKQFRPEKPLLDAMVRLSRAAATSPILPSTAPRTADRSLHAATAGLLALMIISIALIAWLRSGVIR
jgi:hypothetical protein